MRDLSAMLLPSRQSGRQNSVGILLGFSFLLVAAALVYLQNYTLSVTVIVLGGILGLSFRSKSLSILATIAFLILLGDIRRITALIAGFQTLDPLVLVGAFLAMYLSAPMLARVRLTEPLSKALLPIMFVMALEMFNPQQGPVAVGISGALFFLVPTLWFWIGRKYASDELLETLFFRVILPLGVAAALLGIAQAFIGFFPWETAWAKTQGPQYFLTNGGHPRAFAFSSSSAEYGSLLLITLVIICGAAMTGRRIYLLFLPIIGTAMVLSSMRGPLVRAIFAIAVMWAIRGRNVRAWLPRLGLGLVVGLGLLSYSASKAAVDTTAPAVNSKNSTASIAGARVAQGLAHPFESKYSTGGIHAKIFWDAIKSGFSDPVGVGIGATTIGAGKFGGNGSVSFSSEIDISDMFLTCGVLGGFLYLWLLVSVCRAVPGFVFSGLPLVRILTVGVLASLLGSWISLAQYSTAAIAWMCIGALAYHAHLATVPVRSNAARTFPTPAMASGR